MWLWILYFLFGAAIVLMTLLYVFITKHYGHWKRLGVPSNPPKFPFGNLGSVICQRESTTEFFQALYEAFEVHRFAGYVAIREPILLLRDPELIKDVLVKNFSSFHDRGFIANEEENPLAGHLFNLCGDRWKALRQKLSPTFTSGKMKFMFPLVCTCGQELQKTVESQIQNNRCDVEIKDLLARYTTDVIGSVAFGVNVDSLANPEAEFRVVGRRIFEPNLVNALRNALVFLAPSLNSILHVATTEPVASKYFIRLVEETVAYRESCDYKRNDFLQLLMALREDGADDNRTGEVKLTMRDLQAQAFIFFVGGFETSATTLTFCLYELARNPEVQRKLAEEVDRVIKDKGFTYESLALMHYMDQVISETLRLYPAIPILFRQCTKDYKIYKECTAKINEEDESNVISIKTGTKVIIPIIGIHRDSKYYPNPNRFDPERFSEEANENRKPFTYFPFGEGPRICIGMRFAGMQMKVGLASIISKFEIRINERTLNPLILDPNSLIPTIKGGMWITFVPRISS